MSAADQSAPGNVKYVDGYSGLGPEVVAVIWSLSAISGLVLGFRVFCKVTRNRGLWWDDYILILSWIFLVIPSATATVEVQLGFGNHVYEINPANLSQLGLLGQVTAFCSILGALLSKVSFAITLLRLSKGWVKGIIWFIIVTITGSMGLSAIIIWTQCTPVNKIWDRTQQGTCWDPTVVPNYNTFSGIYSGVMDLVLALLPWTFILGLQMTLKERIAVGTAMSMGIFAGITGFLKSSKIHLLASGDFTYYGAPLVEWGAAEVAVTIIATSIPVLRALFTEIKRKSTRAPTHPSQHRATGASFRVSATHSAVAAAQSRSRQRTETGDDGSDISIIGCSDKIIKTSDFSISYQQKTDGSEDLEMNQINDVYPMP